MNAVLRDTRSYVLLLAFVLLELATVLVGLKFPVEACLAIAGAWGLWYVSRKTFTGICVLILLHYFVIRGTKDVSIAEIVFALCFASVLGVWFFRKLFLRRQPILTEKFDYALAGFFLLCACSIIPAVLFGSNVMKWLREFIPFLTLLYIFPLREQVNSPKRLAIVIACFLLLCLAVAVDNVLSYKAAVTNVVYAWELLSSRRHANEPLFMAMVIAASSFLILAKSKLAQLATLVVLAFFGITLALTFSRGYWVGALAGLLMLFWLFPARLKGRMLVYLSVFSLLVFGVIFLFFGDLATFVLDTVTRRFTTVGQAGQDLSFLARVAETEAVLSQIQSNPIMGYGFGKMYSFDPPIPMEMPTWYVHNTYLFLWYKVGLLALLCLLTFMSGIFQSCLRAYKTAKTNQARALLLGIVACLTGLAVVSFSSPQMVEKDSALLVTLLCGVAQSISMRQNSRPPRA